jgi:Flp pilus assembly protein TadG
MIGAAGIRLVAVVRDTRASVATEAALLFPLLVLTLNGAFELTQYSLAVNKLDRGAQTLCQLLARAPAVAKTDVVGQIPYQAAANVAQPFNVYLDGRVVVSLVVNRTTDSLGPVVLWQDSYGKATKSSKVGSEGKGATVPAKLVPQGSMTFVVEVFYDFRPKVFRRFFGGALDEVGEIHRITYHMPRFALFAG